MPITHPYWQEIYDSFAFADINFDSQPDLGITTRFGTPNLYLDYWVFNADTKQYVFVGNLPKLKLSKKDETITINVKNSAESYETTKWYWQGNKFKKK